VNLFSVLTSQKSFALPIIGSVRLNRLGLHVARMKLANLMLGVRRFQISGLVRPAEYAQFKRDGILALENFLPEDDFAKLVAEVKATMQAADAQTPIEGYGEQGFGKKHNYPWGFDRYDGGTLNRFYTITAQQPATQQFVDNRRLKRLTSFLGGAYHDPGKYYLYKLYHGQEAVNADSQKAIHRDTFHSAIKLWYFIEDVKPEHGPFHYAPGTHRLSRKRLAWEKQRSIQASIENKGGAFRITPADLSTLGDGDLQPYPVKANTLVIADIRGFHCRGQALADQARLSIYANIRPAPFLPAWPTAWFKRR